MSNAQIRGLIVSLKTAAIQGDKVTTAAVREGIRRFGRPARGALEEELASTPDSAVRAALSETLDEID